MDEIGIFKENQGILRLKGGEIENHVLSNNSVKFKDEAIKRKEKRVSSGEELKGIGFN